MKIALQMDPLASIRPKTDTTLRLGLEAQARGHELWYYTPNCLSWREGRVIARAHRVTLHANPDHYFDLGEAGELDLQTMDIVLLRQDPPFNMAYLTTTYLLEQLHPKTRVINHPASVRNLPEKWFPTCFPGFMPPTLISADPETILAFRAAQGEIVIKPLYGHGGRGVFRASQDEPVFQSELKAALAGGEPIVVQRFLPEVKDGDRRVILINGQVAGVIGRLPAEGEIRANTALGGTAVKAELTARQREICAAVGPVLKEKGLMLAGLDLIGDYLTEINITSPTGINFVNALYGVKLESVFWDAVEF